jgi:caa(3)-type oxidase subunit IV
MSEHHTNYKKIYFTLLVLLVVSVAGPFMGIFWVTLITAFGIALVKANLVIQNFMHLREEKRIIKWVLVTSLVLMGLMMAGISPDVLRHEGQNWVNYAAQEAVARGIDTGDHGGAEEHAEAAEEHVDEPSPQSVAESVAEVAQEFDAEQTYNQACGVCHGNAGDGNGPAGGAMSPKPANFTDAAFWTTRDDERIFNAIKNGAASVGGSPLMVGWSASYDDDQIRGIIGYLKTAFKPE